MFSNRIKRLLVVGVLLGMGLVAVGLDLPPVVPKGPDWQIYWDLEWKGTCDCYSWETFTLDTSAARDFTVSEKAAQKTAFLDLFDGHCTFRGDATYTYNCHGYVFDGSESSYRQRRYPEPEKTEATYTYRASLPSLRQFCTSFHCRQRYVRQLRQKALVPFG